MFEDFKYISEYKTLITSTVTIVSQIAIVTHELVPAFLLSEKLISVYLYTFYVVIVEDSKNRTSK